MFSVYAVDLLRCGIALDVWMFPLDEEIYARVKQPIFFINSEKFQWAGNIMAMRKLVPPDSSSTQRKMVTIKYGKSIHSLCLR